MYIRDDPCSISTGSCMTDFGREHENSKFGDDLFKHPKAITKTLFQIKGLTLRVSVSNSFKLF